MPDSVLRWPWVFPAASLMAVLTGVLLVVRAEPADIGYLFVDVVVGTTYPVVGALIVTRRRRHPAGWLFIAGGTGLAFQALTGGYAVSGLLDGWPGAAIAAWVTNWIFFVGFAPLLFLPLFVPDGRLPSRRWRPVFVALVAAASVLLVLLMFRDSIWLWGVDTPNPVGFVPTDTVLAPAFGVLIVALAAAGVTALAVRLRARDDVLRRQLTPVLAAALLLAAALTTDALLEQNSPLGTFLLTVTLPLVPVATAVSIFRSRLFEVEVYLRRTVVYAAATVLLLGVYLAVVTTLSTLFRGDDGALVPLFGTAAVALAFAPLRDLLQRTAGRMLFGDRGDPSAALSRLGSRLEASADAGRLLDGAAETLAATLKLPAVRIVDRDGLEVSAFGEPGSDALRLPLRTGGETEGELLVSPRAPGERLSAGDTAVLVELGRQVAVALAASRLFREVQASRARLVVAREEERKYLRRELHDGLGPGLAAIGLRLDVIRAKAPDELTPRIAAVRSLTDSLVADVRRMVHDLRPAALDELGLVRALEDLALRSDDGPEVTVTTPGHQLPPLSAAVEVAAYRIVQEALTNALKHSGAEQVSISAATERNRLVLQVADDGRGLPEDVVEGVGSGSMRDRAAELGGVLRRVSRPGGGTMVEAELPL